MHNCSGISAATLAGVTTTVAQARRHVARFVGPDTLLLGHTLENDLKALKLVHPRCIDTSLLFMHPRGLPYRSALRTLAKTHLGIVIQEGEHDSVADARATRDLAALRIGKGPTWGCPHLLQLAADAGKHVMLVDRPEVLNQHAPGGATLVQCSSDEEASAAQHGWSVSMQRGRVYAWYWTKRVGSDGLFPFCRSFKAWRQRWMDQHPMWL